MPAQRASRPVLVCSCLAHSTCFTPAALNFSPAPSPAISSSWPMWVKAPYSLYRLEPELVVTIGMPALAAAATASFTAAGSASDTARPATLSVTAWLIMSDCFLPSLLEPWYLTVIPRSLPAFSAPFWNTDQNTPPSPWGITAMVMLPPWVAWTWEALVDEPAAAEVLLPAVEPPLLPHPARAIPANAASAASR